MTLRAKASRSVWHLLTRARARRPWSVPWLVAASCALATPWALASARWEPDRPWAQLTDAERVQADESRLEAEARQIQARLIAGGRVYSRLVSAGWLPSLEGSGGLWEHLSLLARLRTVLRRDLERERHLTRERIEAARLASEQAQRRYLAGGDPAFREQERASAFLRAFGGKGSPTQHTAVYAALGPADAQQRDVGVRALKGKLPFPVTGRVEISTIPSPGKVGSGLLVKAEPGAMARTVYPGRVAFADSYGEYGRSVILEHGSGYYSLSAGLGAIRVRVGDELESGAILGSCGQGGVADDATTEAVSRSMYFELRQGARVLEPGPWFGL